MAKQLDAADDVCGRCEFYRQLNPKSTVWCGGAGRGWPADPRAIWRGGDHQD
ncbi:hypothetical protein QP597_05035 [Providencia stuartii]|nr:hypothetical protein [Providencia stuartii]